MRTEIRFIDSRPSERLAAHAEEKITKLQLEFNWIEHCKISFRRNKNDKKKNKLSELEVKIPGQMIYAEAAEEKFLQSCDEAFEKVRKQLEKVKTKITA